MGIHHEKNELHELSNVLQDDQSCHVPLESKSHRSEPFLETVSLLYLTSCCMDDSLPRNSATASKEDERQ